MQEAIADLQARVARLERKVLEVEAPAPRPAAPASSDHPLWQEIGDARRSVPDVVAGESARGGAEEEVLGKWFPRLGALALVIGAAFGFRYAVDQGWIGPLFRVMLGVLLGAGLVAAGEVAKRLSWTPYATAISGGGVGVLYLSVWASVRLYDLVPPGAGLAALSGVTALGLWLSLRHDAQPLAVLAVLGGFAAPFVTGTATGEPLFFYAYVLALDVVAIVVGIVKGWRVTERVAFAGTWLVLPVGWESFPLFFTGATVAFLLFGILPYVKALRGHTTPDVPELAAVVTNGVVYFLPLLVRLPGSRGIFTAALSATYALAAVGLWRGAPEARNLRSVTAGMALLFAVAWAPVTLELEYVPITWTLQALVLVVATGASRAAGIGRAALGNGAGCAVLAAAIVTQLTTASLGWDALVDRAFGHVVLPLGVVVLAIVAYVEKRWPSSSPDTGEPALVGANTLALSWVSLELYSYMATTGAAPDPADLQFGLSALWSVYAAGLLAVGIARRSVTCRLMSMCLFGVVVVKMVVHDLWLLDTLQRLLGFMGIGALLLIASFGYNAFKEMLFGEEAGR